MFCLSISSFSNTRSVDFSSFVCPKERSFFFGLLFVFCLSFEFERCCVESLVYLLDFKLKSCNLFRLATSSLWVEEKEKKGKFSKTSLPLNVAFGILLASANVVFREGLIFGKFGNLFLFIVISMKLLLSWTTYSA